MTQAIPSDVSKWVRGKKIENASLFCQKYMLPIDYGADKKKQKSEALRQLTQETKPSMLSGKRTKSLIQLISDNYGEQSRIVYAKLQSRLAINLSESLLDNAGLALDRTLGNPYIPGSAVKGCCHHAAYWMWKNGELDETILHDIFGQGANDEDSHKGWITFLPAHPLSGAQIELDILTPHPRINGEEKNPVPVEYPVVKSGAQFAFIYLLNPLGCRQSSDKQRACLDAMDEIIERALDNGFGAKTAAGLGWFERDREYEAEMKAAREAEIARKQEEEARRAAEKAKQEQLEKEKQEQDNKRLENERKRKEEEEKLQAQLANASPAERMEYELNQLSRSDFEGKLRQLPNESEENQKIILRVFQSKNKRNRDRWLRNRRIGPVVKATANSLGIEL